MDKAFLRKLERQIQRAPICEPVDGEFVDECYWSKTGWAIWVGAKDEFGSYCTCRPAIAPSVTNGIRKSET